MSKVSVFRFIIGSGTDPKAIQTLIENYLASRGFRYLTEDNTYLTGRPDTREDVKLAAYSLVESAVLSAVTGGTASVYSKVNHGLKYTIDGDELVIKAFLLTRNGKSFIHSTFNNSAAGASYYSDLKNNLFRSLSEINVVQTGKEIEVIRDGSEQRTVKTLVIYAVVLLVLVAFVLLFFMNK